MRKIFLLLLILSFVGLACASGTDESLEKAHFALDAGDWNTAITEASAVFTKDASNIDAALLLSAGYAGRANVDLLLMMEKIIDETNTESLFSAIHATLVSTLTSGTGLNDLRSAIAALSTDLSPQPTSGEPRYDDHQFQLGVLEAIEAFSLPSLLAKRQTTDAIIVANIVDTAKANAQTDFLNADNHLINAGIASNNILITAIRKNYCVLKNSSPAGTSGFTRAVLRDITLCQLTEPTSARAALRSSDFESSITLCTDLNFSACSGDDATEL